MLPMMEMAFLLSGDVAQLRNKHHAIEASDDNVSSKLQLLTSDLQALADRLAVRIDEFDEQLQHLSAENQKTKTDLKEYNDESASKLTQLDKLMNEVVHFAEHHLNIQHFQIRLTNCKTLQGIQIKLTNRQNIQIKLTNHQNFQIKRLM